MIKLRNILHEVKDLKYYDFQIVLTPGRDGTVFYHKDGKIQKNSMSVSENPLIHNYRNVNGMIKSALKLVTPKSKLTIWDDTGMGKSMPATLQNIKLIKR